MVLPSNGASDLQSNVLDSKPVRPAMTLFLEFGDFGTIAEGRNMGSTLHTVVPSLPSQLIPTWPKS